MPYQLIDHTADVAIRVKADSLDSLFIDSAKGMFKIIGNPSHGVDQKVHINLTTESLEDLMHDWLTELLYIYETDNISFSKFKFKKLDKIHLEATAYGQVIEPENAQTEIKAVTYHKLKIKKEKKGYRVDIIFDI